MQDSVPFPPATEHPDVMQSSNGGCYDFGLDGYDEVRPQAMGAEKGAAGWLRPRLVGGKSAGALAASIWGLGLICLPREP